MIRKLQPADLTPILHIVNDAAEAYKGRIPEDRWKEPYMSIEELREEIASGVEFYGWLRKGTRKGITSHLRKWVESRGR